MSPIDVKELEELHSALEEAKADIVGLWALRFLTNQVSNCYHVMFFKCSVYPLPLWPVLIKSHIVVLMVFCPFSLAVAFYIFKDAWCVIHC